jgi:hypothetical protein
VIIENSTGNDKDKKVRWGLATKGWVGGLPSDFICDYFHGQNKRREMSLYL